MNKYKSQMHIQAHRVGLVVLPTRRAAAGATDSRWLAAATTPECADRATYYPGYDATGDRRGDCALYSSTFPNYIETIS